MSRLFFSRPARGPDRLALGHGRNGVFDERGVGGPRLPGRRERLADLAERRNPGRRRGRSEQPGHLRRRGEQQPLRHRAGQVEQLSSSGTPTASSPFGTGGQDFFVSVAVNPVTHGIYAYQVEGATPQGQKGTSKVSVFSSAGVLGASFAPANVQAELAADFLGPPLLPPTARPARCRSSTRPAPWKAPSPAPAVPGAPSSPPRQSPSTRPASSMWSTARTVDGFSSSPRRQGRTPTRRPYKSGAGANAVAVDVSNNDVFVGDVAGSTYHVVAYNSSGTEFDDFGAGLATRSQFELITGQLAVNSTTHKVYLSNPGGKNLWVFERIAWNPGTDGQRRCALSAGTVDRHPAGHGQSEGARAHQLRL